MGEIKFTQRHGYLANIARASPVDGITSADTPSKTLEVVETYIAQLHGRPRGLTAGADFSTGPPIWMGVLVVSQKPFSLSVRIDMGETQATTGWRLYQGL